MPSPSAWTAWRPVPGCPLLTPTTLAELIDGGQAFRWNSSAETGTWLGGWADCLAELQLDKDGMLHWRAPVSLAPQTEAALPAYLGFESDQPAQLDRLPWRSDPHLAACIAAFPGLRILRQPFGETLLGFLCSATKQIVQIKQMMSLLASRHGRLLISDTPAGPWHALPTWPDLARVPEAELRGCLLGFRARYIRETAEFLAGTPGWLEETERLPYAEAKARLIELPGVGEKVADCVLLFGAGKLEAFPVDVWILKALARRYGLDGWRPPQVAQFGRVHFGSAAGLAQQYLFAWERAHGRR